MSSKSESNIFEILHHGAISQGEKTAYIYLKDGENKEVILTYSSLD